MSLRSRLPSLLAATLLLLLLAALLEVASFGLWWRVRGEPFTFAAARDLRALRGGGERHGARSAGPAAAHPPRVAALLREVTVGEQMLHPYLGYVAHPEAHLLPGRGGGLPVGPFGFYRSAAERRPEPFRFGAAAAGDGGDLRIGVFGGSVAFVLSFVGRETLEEELRRRGAAPRARGVEVVSRALGGYKQPQQVLALTYLLSLGEDFDAVVNLDGFNEVVLALATNARHDVFPAYPQRWPRRVEPVPAGRWQRLVGEVAHLERRRGELARRFAAGPFDRTVTGNLLWLVADRRVGAELAAARRRLAAEERRSGGRRPLTHGPEYAGDEDAVLDGMVELWARASRQMHDLCAGRGIAYHHFLQPNQYVAGSKPLSRWERGNAYRRDHPYRTWVERGYPKLRAAGRRLAASGVAFHDLTELFAGETGSLYADDCCHLNRRGNELLAAAVARAVAGDVR